MNSQCFLEQLSDGIQTNAQFVKDYEALTLPDAIVDTSTMDAKVVKRLMESGAIFAGSQSEGHRNIALRICTSFIQDSSRNQTIVAASELILMRLGNFPMLEKAIHDNGAKDFFNVARVKGVVPLIRLTPSIIGEVARKECDNELSIKGRATYLTDFQSQVFRTLSSKQNVSISAPTSSGKSFVLRRYIINEIISNDSLRVVYIVPTRALISEVQRRLRNLLLEYDVEDVMVLSTSWEVIGKSLPRRVVLVLTPERLQTIQGNSETPFKTDLLIVDEAQKIEDSQRGIILEDTVQNSIDSNPDMQVVFISPYVENPEKLNKVFLRGRASDAVPLKSGSSPVTQTLYFVEWHGNSVELDVVLPEIEGLRRPLWKLDNSVSVPTTHSKIKASFSHNFIKTNPTMIYCNTPAECRSTADAMSNLVSSAEGDAEIDDVVRYLRRYIHPRYYLSDYLKKRIGYHYGPMPPSVRIAVESLFSSLKLKYLCCTSTLAEGVNLPAKNIVIYRPKAGRTRKMKGIAFWNLVGRAGRLGKDFNGSIYCINTNEWDAEVKPDIGGREHEITSSMEEVLRRKKDQIVAYLKEELRAARSDDVATAVIRFLISEIRNENEKLVGDLLTRNEEIELEDLQGIVRIAQEIINKIEIPSSLVLKNSSIDPRLLNDLYLRVRDDPNAPIPVHPLNSKFRDRLRETLEYLDQFFQRNYTVSSSFFAFLGSMWAEEKTLGEIIAKRVEYLVENRKIKGTQAEINRVIEDIILFINNKLTYDICRDVKCYVDILRHVSEEKHRENIPSEKLGYYLELGAHNPTTLTLIENGVPRTEAILASRRIHRRDIQSYEECMTEIAKFTRELRSDIPSMIFNEAFKIQGDSKPITRTGPST